MLGRIMTHVEQSVNYLVGCTIEGHTWRRRLDGTKVCVECGATRRA